MGLFELEWDLDKDDEVFWLLFDDLFSSSLLFRGESWNFLEVGLDFNEDDDDEDLLLPLLLPPNFSSRSLRFRGSRSSRSSLEEVDDDDLVCLGILGKLRMLFDGGGTIANDGVCMPPTFVALGGFRILERRGSRERADETIAAEAGVIRTLP